MKKLEGRAVLCLTLAVMLIIGLAVFVFRYFDRGDEWASFYANDHIYKNGQLTVGKVCDRNGLVLLYNDEEGAHYTDDGELRKATFHVVGDKDYNVQTAANTAFRSKMTGYSPLTGTSSFAGENSRKVKLTIDAEINRTAYKALAGRDGFISVYNWKTGEILCMVSGPSADPAAGSGNAKDGTYINKVLSATFAPGSTFKLVTAAAAIEELEGMDQWTFSCTGSHEIDGEKITCPMVHGKMDFYSALAKSCNCAFASLAVEMGGDVMQIYVEKLGLTSSYDIDGIKTAAGSFNFDTYNINLGWAGIGQFEDQVNPLSMMVYMGAIAGEGQAAEPVLIADRKVLDGSSSTINLLAAGTARQLKAMMRNNVKETYGEANYEGLELHAKSGTAETGSGVPNSWFCGFSGDYAFAVCIEGGGRGAGEAAAAAKAVLQKTHDRLDK